MKKYTVAITETLCKTADIIADSFDDAYAQASNQYHEGRITLTSLNFVDSDIEVLSVEEKSPYIIHFTDTNKIIVMIDAEENVLNFIANHGTDPYELLLAPEDVITLHNGYRLKDYETAYDSEPEWVSEHQYLWF